MSTCIKDLFDYDSTKKCRVCKNILKSNFYKSKTKKIAIDLSVFPVLRNII